MYSQTNLIYEQELVIEMKQKSEIFRYHMYIMFEEAYKMNENVCVTYIQVSYYLNKWEICLIFEITIQIDYILLFSWMTLF